MAQMRYKVWGDQAEQDGFLNVARLFRAISRAEQAHATGHFKELRNETGAFLVAAGGGFGLNGTSENLQGAIEGETFEVEEMYPTYVQTAEFQSETGAVRSFNWAFAAERIHAAMFQEAKAAVDAGQDLELGPIQVCTNCGHTLVGDIPERCPVCNVLGAKWYETFA